MATHKDKDTPFEYTIADTLYKTTTVSIYRAVKQGHDVALKKILFERVSAEQVRKYQEEVVDYFH